MRLSNAAGAASKGGRSTAHAGHQAIGSDISSMNMRAQADLAVGQTAPMERQGGGC